MKIEIEAGNGEEKEKEYGDYDKWEIESAMRTLMEAEEIKADKEKMKYVAQCMKEHAKKMTGVIGSLDDLKKVAYSKKDEMEDDED